MLPNPGMIEEVRLQTLACSHSDVECLQVVDTQTEIQQPVDYIDFRNAIGLWSIAIRRRAFQR